MTTRNHMKTKKSKQFRKTRSKKRQRGGGNTPSSQKDMDLIDASYNGDTEIVKKLLKEGADVNATRNDGRTVGRTALHGASSNGYTEIVEKLMEKGADVNAKGKNDWTALHGASGKGYTKTVAMLLCWGADVNAEDDDRNTALSLASYYGHPKTVELLKEVIKVRGNKEESMELVRNRDVKIPSLRIMSERQISTCDKSVLGRFEMLPPGKLGGKRKTRKAKKSRRSKKSKRKTRKSKNKKN